VLTGLGKELINRFGAAGVAGLPPIPPMQAPSELPMWGSSSVLSLRQLDYVPPAGLHISGLPLGLPTRTVELIYKDIAEHSALFAALPQTFVLSSLMPHQAVVGHEAFGDHSVAQTILRELSGGTAGKSATIPSVVGDLDIRLPGEVK
jgi:hypothetical protein